jgi:hypothetical protein
MLTPALQFHLLIQILRQRPQCSLAKQQIDILQTNLRGFFEEKEDNREGDNLDNLSVSTNSSRKLVVPEIEGHLTRKEFRCSRNCETSKQEGKGETRHTTLKATNTK